MLPASSARAQVQVTASQQPDPWTVTDCSHILARNEREHKGITSGREMRFLWFFTVLWNASCPCLQNPDDLLMWHEI